MPTAIIFFVILASTYFLIYWLNRKTPVPKGCEDLTAGCSGCHDITCTHNPSLMQREE